MRITHKSNIIPYQRNLQNIQSRRAKEQMRISSGKYIQEISDSPKRLVDSKMLNNRIEQNKKYLDVIELSHKEMLSAEGKLQGISDKLQKIRQLGIDATQTGNMGNLPSLAVYVKGIIGDIVNDASGDHNGKYLFSGTKTTGASLDKTDEASNNMPFEIVEGEKTGDNPSGLRVVFKGNFEDREINKDRYSNEVINQTADELFGANGTEMFENIIEVYNILAYREDGTKRTDEDTFGRLEVQRLNDLQKKIGDRINKVDTVTGRNGGMINRFESIRQQMESEIVRMKDLLSLKEDTDVAEATLRLQKEESAMQYSLQTGRNLFSNSLFDFLGL